MVGRLAMGYISDSVDPWLLGFSTLCSSALATFVLWGLLSNSFAGLLAFGLVYGTIAGGWTSLWTAFIRPIASAYNNNYTAAKINDYSTEDDLSLSTSLFGYLLLSRGIGNIASTPISNALMRSNPSSSLLYHHSKTGFAVGEGKFEHVIIYVGICFATASMVAAVGFGIEKSRARMANGSA